jgi:hypothetical protein
LPLSAVAIASCGTEVPLENRPCPCSSDWTCCPLALVCVPRGEACPAPPTAYCQPGWTHQDTWCVYDAEVSDADVCHFVDSPTVQVDFDGERDECSAKRDIEGLYRSFDCTVSFGGSTVQGMVVDHGAQVVQPGRDRCRLRASLLIAPPP